MATGHNVVLEEGRLGHAEPSLRPQPAAADFSKRFPDGIAATGRGKRLALREGLDLTCIDFQMQDVCTSTGSSKGTQLSIHILLDAAGHGWVADGDGVPLGSPIYAFLQRARLDRARSLIEGGGLSVTEAALQVGYSNPSHFARLFRREFGIAPSSALGSSSSEI